MEVDATPNSDDQPDSEQQLSTPEDPVDAYYAAQTFGFTPDTDEVDDDADSIFTNIEDILQAGRALPEWLWEHRHPRHQEHVADVVIHFACDAGARIVRRNVSEAQLVELIGVCGAVFASLLEVGRAAGVSAITLWDSVLGLRQTEHASAAFRLELQRVLTELVPACRPTSARVGMIDGLAWLSGEWAESLVERLRSEHPRKDYVDHAAKFAVARIRAGGWSNFRALPGEPGALGRMS